MWEKNDKTKKFNKQNKNNNKKKKVCNVKENYNAFPCLLCLLEY
jgi:hypothetical protein